MLPVADRETVASTSLTSSPMRIRFSAWRLGWLVSLALVVLLPTIVMAQRADDFVSNGDMLLFRSNFSLPSPEDQVIARQRGVVAFDAYQSNPWPAGEMPLVFDGIDDSKQQQLLTYCGAWTAFTGVRCVRRTDQARFVIVRADKEGCFASVGAPTNGNGIINLGSSFCWEPYHAIHELGHGFGLMHEHQRPNRDDYISIVPENIQPGDANFVIVPSNRAATEYDFDSITHYGPAFGSRNGNPTIVPKPQFVERAKNMGRGTAPSALDRTALASVYNIAPAPRNGSSPRVVFDRLDFLSAMQDLDRVYVGELHRANGLSIGGRPDFLGIAAWIFDVYLSGRATGYTQGEAFYNVRAWISQSDEWRSKNPAMQPLALLPTNSPIHLDRGEYLEAMYRLDDAYKTELLRPNGLSLNGAPDLLGIAAWIFDVYLNTRLNGGSPDQAWNMVLTAIRNSDEYRQRH
jgi:hypothetical protein